MDPTGGIGLWLVLAVIVIGIALFVFLPLAWAIGITLFLVVAVLGLLAYVFSTARFT